MAIQSHCDPSRLALVKRLAGVAGTGDGRRALQLLARLSAPTPTHGLRPSPEQTENGNIGIWQRKTEDGRTVYTRAASLDSPRFWADVERLTVPPDARPVVLLGESVARGYYYDPHFNPAAALNAMINTDAAAGACQVVDLARVDCSRHMLIKLARASLALQPAAWVVFAGNNWSPYLDLGLDDYHQIGTRLAEPSRWSRIRDYMEGVCRTQVAEFARTLAGLSETHSIPVVIVVPEFNLTGWRNEYGASIPLLSGPQARRWHSLRAEAEEALTQHHYGRVSELAAGMLALDRGGAPRTYEILADCRIAAGELEEAGVLLEKARDAALSVPVRRSPRCFSVVQEALRSEAQAHGFTCVDLPRRLRDYLGGGLPGHRLFHDYCHLTVEGIHVSMAHVSQALLPLLDRAPKNWNELYAARPAVKPSVLAEAHLLAALHNGRWGQSYQTIRRECELAIQHNPDIGKTMLMCLDFYIRRTPSVLCHSFGEITRQNSLAAVNFLAMTSDPAREKMLNPSLVQALTDVSSSFDTSAVQKIGDLLAAEHGLTARPLNLLATAYCCSSCADPEFGWLQRSGVFKAYSAQSTFKFVVREPVPVSCSVTYRVPGLESGAASPLCVTLNGVPAGALECSGTWRTAKLQLDRSQLRSGWNTIALCWPQPVWDTDWHLRELGESLELGEIPELFPAYGELHAFTAASGCRCR